MTVASAKEIRDQELVYWITRWVLHFYYSKDDGLADFGLFNQLKTVVEEWYETRVRLVGETDPVYKRMLVFFDAEGHRGPHLPGDLGREPARGERDRPPDLAPREVREHEVRPGPDVEAASTPPRRAT